MGPAPILAQRRLQTPHEFEKNLDYWAEINTYSPKKTKKNINNNNHNNSKKNNNNDLNNNRKEEEKIA